MKFFFWFLKNVSSLRDFGGWSFCLIRRFKPPVNKMPSLQDFTADITPSKRNMQKAAKELDFIEAARLRDEMYGLEKMMEGK